MKINQLRGIYMLILLQVRINMSWYWDTISWASLESCSTSRTKQWPGMSRLSIWKIPSHFFWSNDLHETEALQEASTHLQKILNMKYALADLITVVQACRHLTEDIKSQLHALLCKFEHLFDGTLGTWKNKPYNIELKEGAKPYHSRPFPVPKIRERTLKVELDRLINLGVFKWINASKWATPTFVISKKDATVRFISDFCELNKCIKHKPFPIPKIQDLLLKLEGFQHAMSLDLNMGYYHIELMPFSKRLCTIVTPWGQVQISTSSNGSLQ